MMASIACNDSNADHYIMAKLADNIMITLMTIATRTGINNGGVAFRVPRTLRSKTA